MISEVEEMFIVSFGASKMIPKLARRDGPHAMLSIEDVMARYERNTRELHNSIIERVVPMVKRGETAMDFGIRMGVHPCWRPELETSVFAARMMFHSWSEAGEP